MGHEHKTCQQAMLPPRSQAPNLATQQLPELSTAPFPSPHIPFSYRRRHCGARHVTPRHKPGLPCPLPIAIAMTFDPLPAIWNSKQRCQNRLYRHLVRSVINLRQLIRCILKLFEDEPGSVHGIPLLVRPSASGHVVGWVNWVFHAKYVVSAVVHLDD